MAGMEKPGTEALESHAASAMELIYCGAGGGAVAAGVPLNQVRGGRENARRNSSFSSIQQALLIPLLRRLWHF